MKFLLLIVSFVFAQSVFASERAGQCGAEELKRGCYTGAVGFCDPFNPVDCVLVCRCETEPVKRYPTCKYRSQFGYEYGASGLTREQACQRAKDMCEGYAPNVCTLVP